ncbi:hypothetical protein SAMN05444166_5809 [Singulisphaera sp. GP187]|uniref:hypothetical protein n=1 Tax=Singulisphaera sp. GP187 TaxID=1882752 RepID=UPI00092A7E0C|nr:hypothetical protein [Singulisphaera sp. GP187]SIO58785.1 hypothetical protein SAMN05444166_5809 [Singulisphaera sp. GP187]
MSIAIRSKRLIASEHSTSLSSSSIVELIYQDIEAPEQAEVAREAPEMRAGSVLEAPDAGEGRHGLVEHEFTHGRSQS